MSCPRCDGIGWVCENHAEHAWDGECCGGAGMPCGLCNLDQRAILQFSGGKDSLALLLLMRPSLDKIEVCFVDSGNVTPHVLEFIIETCHRVGARLTVIRQPETVLQRTEREGLPSDIVPTWRSPDSAWINAEDIGQRVQSSTACCSATLWQPMYRHILSSGIKLVLRGAKKADAHRGVADTVDENGITFRNPLWDWSTERVLEYIRAEGFEPARHYPEVMDSMDCWCCTGYTTAHYKGATLRYIRREYPGLWPVLADRLMRVNAAIATDLADHNATLDRSL